MYYTHSLIRIHVFSNVIGKSHDQIVGCGLMVHGLAHLWSGSESYQKKPNDFRISFIKSNYWNIFSFNFYTIGGNLKANTETMLLHFENLPNSNSNEYIFPLPKLMAILALLKQSNVKLLSICQGNGFPCWAIPIVTFFSPLYWLQIFIYCIISSLVDLSLPLMSYDWNFAVLG